MKVSIITATYNSAATIADCLQSVQQQTYPDIEHLIMDGASSDQTIEKVKSLAPHCIIRSEKDAGMYDAMNKGIGLAQGEIIGILNSDDQYVDAGIIEKVVRLFEQTGAEAIYGDLRYIDAATGRTVRYWKAGKFNKKAFLYGWMPPHPSFFVRKSVYERHGAFRPGFYSASDYELMLRFLYRYNIKVAYLQEVLVNMRMGGVSNQSLRNRLLANKGDRKAWEENGLTPYWFTMYLKPLRKITQFLRR